MTKFISTNQKEKMEKVEDFICSFYDINKKELFSKSKDQHFCNIRFLLWYLLKKDLKVSAKVIGSIYGRDHSSILYGVKKVQKKEMIDELNRIVEEYSKLGISCV